MRPLSGWTDPGLGTALGLPEPTTDTGPSSTTDPSNTGPSETTSENIPIIAGSVGGVVAIAGIAIVLLLVHRHKKNANKTDRDAWGPGTGVAPSDPPPHSPPLMTTYDPHYSMVYPPPTAGRFWDPQPVTYYQPAQPVASPGPRYSSYKPSEQPPIIQMPGARPTPQELFIMQH